MGDTDAKKIATARFALMKALNNYEATRTVEYGNALAKACRRLILVETRVAAKDGALDSKRTDGKDHA